MVFHLSASALICHVSYTLHLILFFLFKIFFLCEFPPWQFKNGLYFYLLLLFSNLLLQKGGLYSLLQVGSLIHCCFSNSWLSGELNLQSTWKTAMLMPLPILAPLPSFVCGHSTSQHAILIPVTVPTLQHPTTICLSSLFSESCLWIDVEKVRCSLKCTSKLGLEQQMKKKRCMRANWAVYMRWCVSTNSDWESEVSAPTVLFVLHY
jgi:hypothetical protein